MDDKNEKYETIILDGAGNRAKEFKISTSQAKALIDGKAKIVPVEPSEEMLERAIIEIPDYELDQNDKREVSRDIYKAMIGDE